MPIPVISAQATALQVVQYQNTQDDNKLSKDIEILTVIRKTSDANQEHNQCSLFFYDLITDKQVSVVGKKATIENLEMTSPLDVQPPKELLGQGFFGKVLKGLLQYKNGQQKEVAIKTIYSKYANDEDFYNEVKALQTLENQDHIVQFYFALHDTSGFNCHIIMELGDIDLEEYLEFMQQHPELNINEQQLAKIGHDTFSGMLACLESNIFNLDIKPTNCVIFFSQDKIKIIDLGVLSPKKHLDDKILNTMITQTTDSFIQCILSKANSDHQEIQQKLRLISLKASDDFSVSDEDKAYFKQHIPTYVNDNSFLLQLTQGIFSGESNISDITKAISDIKTKVGLQALTDIRHML
jgi:hypothetical protein